MHAEEMRARLREELSHIPRGNLDQNIFRFAYTSQRQHGLASDPDMTANAALLAAAEAAKGVSPDFVPRYDLDYFSGR